MALRDQGPRDIDVTNHAMHVTDGTTFITTAQQTQLETDLGDTTADLGKTYINYETGQYLEWQGTVRGFIVTGVAGSASVVDAALAVEIQTDATYTYIGEALPGTLLATAAWRVQRIVTATGSTDWADGDSDFDNAATTMSGLTYL